MLFRSDEAAEPLDLLALVRVARQHDHLPLLAQAGQHVPVGAVGETVVIGDLRRRPHDGQRLAAVDAELVQDGGVGLEFAQVVLLLEARVAPELAARASKSAIVPASDCTIAGSPRSTMALLLSIGAMAMRMVRRSVLWYEGDRSRCPC